MRKWKGRVGQVDPRTGVDRKRVPHLWKRVIQRWRR